VVLVACLVTAGAILGSKGLLPKIAAGIPVCTGGESSDYKCYQSRLQTLVNTKGVAAAMSDIKSQYQSNPYVHSECHQLTHVIGRAAAVKYGNVSDAYSNGDDFCQSGYYHGVMEAMAGSMGRTKIVSEVNQICAPLKAKRPYSLPHFNCVHGLGHGLMSVDDYNLFNALSDCDHLDDSWEQQSCYGGVFMQNVMGSITDTRTDFLKADQPMYPCTAVADRYQEACYLNQSSYALRLVNYDFATVFSECGQAPQVHQATCYQSVGRDASGLHNENVSQALSSCEQTSDETARINCSIGAAKDITWQFRGVTEAYSFCDGFNDQQVAVPCRKAADDYERSF
jgi:hypothetical protein